MIILKKQKLILQIIIASIVLAISIYFGTKQIKVKNLVVETWANYKKSKYEILVDVEESILYLFKDGILEKTYECSGGKWSTPSPIGTWKVVQKSTWGEGFRW